MRTRHAIHDLRDQLVYDHSYSLGIIQIKVAWGVGSQIAISEILNFLCGCSLDLGIVFTTVVFRKHFRFVDEHVETYLGVGKISSDHDMDEFPDGVVVRVVLLQYCERQTLKISPELILTCMSKT